MSSKFVIDGEFDNKDIEKGVKQTEKGFKSVEAESKNLGKSVKAASGAIVAAFSIGAIAQFTQKIVETTGQFQKLRAVLENTLGSKSAATQNFKVLNQLASQSNFGLLELTDSYVKLVNQGISPTRKEMLSLQDLANSTGKSFEQLTEALIDGQVGEFERLKEFGIRAQKEGDRVKFTFKGVTTEVANTTSAIKDYIFGLGEIEGVAGSTEKISDTLAGKVSNLGDAFDNLLNNIGQGNNNLLSSALDLLIDGINALSGLIKDIMPEVNNFFSGFIDGWNELIKESIVFRGIINSIIAGFKNAWDAAKLLFDLIIDGFKDAGRLITAIFTGEFLEIPKIAEDAFNRIKDRAFEFGQDIAGNLQEGIKNTIEGTTTEINLFGKEEGEGDAEFAQRLLPFEAMKAQLVAVGEAGKAVQISLEAGQTALAKKIEKNQAEELKRTKAQTEAQQMQIAMMSAHRLAEAKSIKDFGRIAFDIIRELIVAEIIKSIMGSLPFPFNAVVAGGAGAIANGLLSGIGKFAQGGVVGGNSFSGDQTLVLANAGERVMNIPQQEFLLRAANTRNEELANVSDRLDELIDLMTFSEQAVNNVTVDSVRFVDIYDEGRKNEDLLTSG
jgi:hypothetical protein